MASSVSESVAEPKITGSFLFVAAVYRYSSHVYGIENRVYRKGSYVLADVLAMDNSTVGAAPRLFCVFFLK
jgi:hypothetical protein